MIVFPCTEIYKDRGNFFNKNMKAENQVELVLVERRILE